MLIVRDTNFRARTHGDMVLGITGEIVESWLGYKARTKEKDFSAVNIEL